MEAQIHPTNILNLQRYESRKGCFRPENRNSGLIGVTLLLHCNDVDGVFKPDVGPLKISKGLIKCEQIG